MSGGGGDDESIHAAIAGEGIKRRAGGGGNVWERTQSGAGQRRLAHQADAKAPRGLDGDPISKWDPYQLRSLSTDRHRPPPHPLMHPPLTGRLYLRPVTDEAGRRGTP